MSVRTSTSPKIVLVNSPRTFTSLTNLVEISVGGITKSFSRFIRYFCKVVKIVINTSCACSASTDPSSSTNCESIVKKLCVPSPSPSPSPSSSLSFSTFSFSLFDFFSSSCFRRGELGREECAEEEEEDFFFFDGLLLLAFELFKLSDGLFLELLASFELLRLFEGLLASETVTEVFFLGESRDDSRDDSRGELRGDRADFFSEEE